MLEKNMRPDSKVLNAFRKTSERTESLQYVVVPTGDAHHDSLRPWPLYCTKQQIIKQYISDCFEPSHCQIFILPLCAM